MESAIVEAETVPTADPSAISWVWPTIGLLLFAAGSTGWLLSWPQPRDRSSRHWLLLRQGVPLAGMAGGDTFLTALATHGAGRNPADDWVWRLAIEHRAGAMTAVAVAVTRAGSTLSMGVLAGAAVIVLFATRRRSAGALVLVVAVGAGILVSVLKVAVGRSRPPLAQRLVTATTQSFPSGHALASTAILGALGVVALTSLRRRPARRTVLAAAIGLPILIGASRIYLGVHWATDVLGGWCIGLTWLLVCLTILPPARPVLPEQAPD